LERFRGPNAFLRLRNTKLNESWAFEEASIRVYPAGRKQMNLNG